MLIKQDSLCLLKSNYVKYVYGGSQKAQLAYRATGVSFESKLYKVLVILTKTRQLVLARSKLQKVLLHCISTKKAAGVNS